MTTTSENYKYNYEILDLVHIDSGLSIRMDSNFCEVIALANVRIIMKSAIDDTETSVWRELRYVIIDDSGEPSVSYKENPLYGGVK